MIYSFLNKVKTIHFPFWKTKKPHEEERKKEENDIKISIYRDIGKLENITQECRQILGPTDCFEGFRSEFTRALSENFIISHMISVNKKQDEIQSPGPHLGTLNASIPQPRQESSETYMFASSLNIGKSRIMGRIDNHLHLFASIFIPFFKRFNLEVQAQSQYESKPKQITLGSPPAPCVQSDNDYYNNVNYYPLDATADLSFFTNFSHSQLKAETNGVLSFTHHQNITHNFSCGFETLYLHKMKRTSLLLGARYRATHGIWAAQLQPPVATLSYTHKVHDLLSLATELQVVKDEFKNIQALCTVGYEYRMGDLATVKGRINSNLTLSAYIEEILTQNTRLTLSAQCDFKNKNYIWGFGLQFAS